MANLFFWIILSFLSLTIQIIISQDDHEYNLLQSYKIFEPKVVFQVFNEYDANGHKISLNYSKNELKSIFNIEIPTIFITHGWLVNESHVSVTNLRNAYLETKQVNVVEVGWGHFSQNDYNTAYSAVPKVGNLVGKMLVKLLNEGIVTVDGTHLLGYSLGAHIFGKAGSYVHASSFGKISRITGFDPALPGFNSLRSKKDRLDKSDAQFVDAIHTCIGLLGYREPLGHSDFYPNGGSCNQPGCNLASDFFCGHGRSWQYYVESLYHETNFPAVKCNSDFNYRNKNCRNNLVSYMGVAAHNSTRGVHYLRTNGRLPYGRGNSQDP